MVLDTYLVIQCYCFVVLVMIRIIQNITRIETDR